MEWPSLDEAVGQLDEDFAEWLRALLRAEIAELRLYQGVGYLRINGVLRETVIADGDALRRVLLSIEAIDSAVAKGALRSATRVYRGLRQAREVFGVGDLSELVGEVVRDPGFVSTTLDPDVAARFVEGQPDPALVELTLPAGLPAAWLGLAGAASR